MANNESCLILIKQLEISMGRRMNNEIKELDMTMTQVRALSLLLDYPEKQATLKDLEKKLQLSQSVTAGIVKRLEQRKYIESFGNSEDKRIKIVKITPLGEQQCRCSDKILYQLEEDMLSCLTKSELLILRELLNKIKKFNERK